MAVTLHAGHKPGRGSQGNALVVGVIEKAEQQLPRQLER
jgi:hypothetical protein